MAPRSAASENRLRDAYPKIFREIGISEQDVEQIMAGYDDPVIETACPASPVTIARLEREFKEYQSMKKKRRV